jgi:hypothetical protein
MGSEILRPDSQDEAPTSMPEVEFALVLSRMIDSIQSDPEHLRATIYELARHKIREQSISQSLAERRQLSKALESAIQGVETFVKKNETKLDALPSPGPAQRQPRIVGLSRADFRQPEPEVIEVEGSHRAATRSTFRLTTPWRFGIVVAIVLTVALAITQRETLRNWPGRVISPLTPATPKAAQIAPPVTLPIGAASAPELSATTPTAYGIYAVSADKLYELGMLPGRAPDIRIAVSPAILTPSRTVLPDGHLKFVIYRRDSAISAADHADVRIVAQIMRELSFDPAGKPVARKIDDTWVIRNISLPFRTAPKKDNPDMYEVQSENPESALTPGRYALVLKGQAYDFSVAGPISDPRQCLERMAATNGQFYSGCQKP